jgi:hypothetical protein
MKNYWRLFSDHLISHVTQHFLRTTVEDGNQANLIGRYDGKLGGSVENRLKLAVCDGKSGFCRFQFMDAMLQLRVVAFPGRVFP